MDFRVVINECQVLALLCRERRHGRCVPLRGAADRHFESICAKAVVNADAENRELSVQHRAYRLPGSGVKIPAQLLRVRTRTLEIGYAKCSVATSRGDFNVAILLLHIDSVSLDGEHVTA